MAQIVIHDLPENAELDDAAMLKILGGRPTQGFGLQQPQTLILDRLAQADFILPQIGLGSGFLGSKNLL